MITMRFGGCWRSLWPQKLIWEWYSFHIWIAFDFAFPKRYIMIGLLQVCLWRLLEVKILEVNWHIWIAFDLAFPMIYIMIGLFDVGFWRLLEVKIFWRPMSIWYTILEASDQMQISCEVKIWKISKKITSTSIWGWRRPNSKHVFSWLKSPI